MKKTGEFLLDPRNKAFVAGKSDELRWIWLHINYLILDTINFILYIILPTVWIGLVVFFWLTSQQVSIREHGILAAGLLMGVLIIYLKIKSEEQLSFLKVWRKYHRLQNDGEFIDGKIISVQRIPSNSSYLSVYYGFHSPSGKFIKARQGKNRPDVADLPSAGTTVTILYAGDDCHLLL